MQRLIVTILISILIVPGSLAQDSARIKKEALYMGLSAGTWFPDRKNNVLRNPLVFGFMVDFKGKKNAYGLTFDLINRSGTEPFKVKFGDSILIRNTFTGAHLTIDYAREFWSKNRLVLEGIGGIGFGTLSYYNPDLNTDIGKSSLVLNPGIGLRYLIGRKLFLQIKTQYCIANYKLNDNVSTNLRGNYLTTKIIFGRRY